MRGLRTFMPDDSIPSPSLDRDIGPDGIKNLTLDNWQSIDPTSVLLIELDTATGRPLPITPDRWAEWLLEPQLDPSVPGTVQTMFNVARGAMLYGSFFYPLYTLGTEQLYRVADAATWHRCRQLGKPLPAAGPNRETFADRVTWLVGQGVISNASWWGHGHGPANPGGVRMVRNLTSHSTFQQLDLPSTAVIQVRQVADQINELFAPEPKAGED
jgi:hypothetical protein